MHTYMCVKVTKPFQILLNVPWNNFSNIEYKYCYISSRNGSEYPTPRAIILDLYLSIALHKYQNRTGL